MKITEKLLSLVHYYNATRQSGHTTLMLRGILTADQCSILTHDLGMFNYIKKNWSLANGAHPVTLNNMEKLRGSRLPLAIDNAALHTIFEQSLNEIQRLNKENTNLKQKLTQVKNILNK